MEQLDSICLLLPPADVDAVVAVIESDEVVELVAPFVRLAPVMSSFETTFGVVLVLFELDPLFVELLLEDTILSQVGHKWCKRC